MTDQAWNALLRIITPRAHGRAELSRKLRQRGCDEGAIRLAIEKAEDLQLLESEDELASRYAQQLRERGATPLAATQKLASRGFASDVSDRAIDTVFETWNGRIEALRMLESEHDLERAARRLSRRGFSADDLVWAMRHVRQSRRKDEP
ncbi:MAG: hypothetical protein ACFB9M_19680 [Myxococcota bacterium]